MSNIEQVTSILGETMTKDRVERDMKKMSNGIELTDQQWNELNEIFTDNMKEVIWKTYYYTLDHFTSEIIKKEWSNFIENYEPKFNFMEEDNE